MIVAHETILISFNGIESPIDIEIAPLILYLWKRGIETIFCCQGDKGSLPGQAGRAYISFPPGDHAKRFTKELIALGVPESRFTSCYIQDSWSPTRREEWDCYWRSEYQDFVFVYRFPNEGIAEIINLFQDKKGE